MTDLEIIQRIKEDDSRVITDLYKHYFKEIVQYLKFKFYPTISEQDAEDIFVKSFNILCGNIKEGKNKKKEGSIKSYIYRICWNLAYDETNRRDRASGKITVVDPPTPPEPPDPIAIDIKELLLTQMVWQLTEPCKTLLRLFWYDGKRDSEIIALTKYPSTDTVKNQRSRCMRTLKEKYLTKLVDEKIITREKRTQLLEK